MYQLIDWFNTNYEYTLIGVCILANMYSPKNLLCISWVFTSQLVHSFLFKGCQSGELYYGAAVICDVFAFLSLYSTVENRFSAGLQLILAASVCCNLAGYITWAFGLQPAAYNKAMLFLFLAQTTWMLLGNGKNDSNKQNYIRIMDASRSSLLCGHGT